MIWDSSNQFYDWALLHCPNKKKIDVCIRDISSRSPNTSLEQNRNSTSLNTPVKPSTLPSPFSPYYDIALPFSLSTLSNQTNETLELTTTTTTTTSNNNNNNRNSIFALNYVNDIDPMSRYPISDFNSHELIALHFKKEGRDTIVLVSLEYLNKCIQCALNEKKNILNQSIGVKFNSAM